MTDLKDLTDEQIAAALGKLGKEHNAAEEAYQQVAYARRAEIKRLSDERDRRIIAHLPTMDVRELTQLSNQEGFDYDVRVAIKEELSARKEAYRKEKQIRENPPSKYDDLSDDQLAQLTPEGLSDGEIVKVVRALRGCTEKMRLVYHKLQQVEKQFDRWMTGQPPDPHL
jgi:hypothetical protein